ncbi:MAG: hypothetical protein Q6J74_02020 [Gloeomargarita sp. DG02_1_bins_92]
MNSIYLRFEQGKDSDGDDYYFITLTFKPPEMSTAKYTMIGSDLWRKFPVWVINGSNNYSPIFIRWI